MKNLEAVVTKYYLNCRFAFTAHEVIESHEMGEKLAGAMMIVSSNLKDNFEYGSRHFPAGFLEELAETSPTDASDRCLARINTLR